MQRLCNICESFNESSIILSSAGLKLKPRKCRLFAREVEYLGHVVSEKGISTDPKKIEAVKTISRSNVAGALHKPNGIT
jgi:hypothetical protein